MSAHQSRAAGPSALVTFLFAAVGLLAAVSALLGVRTMDVLTGSMRPHLGPGSLVLTTPMEVDDVRVGDVIAFRPPTGFSEAGNRPVLHRVVQVTPDGPLRRIRTKGDANERPDPWELVLDGHRVARARLHLPMLGWLLAAGKREVGYLGGALVSGLTAVAWTRRLRQARCTCPQAEGRA